MNVINIFEFGNEIYCKYVFVVFSVLENWEYGY